MSGTVTKFCGKGNGLPWFNRDTFCTNRATLVYRIDYCPRGARVNYILLRVTWVKGKKGIHLNATIVTAKKKSIAL